MKTGCPKCQKIFSIKPEMVGRRGKCPKCRVVFAIAEWNAPQPKSDGSSGVESAGAKPPSIVEPPPAPQRSNRKKIRSGGGRTFRIFLLSTVTCVPLGILLGFLIRASIMDSPEPQASTTRPIDLSTQPRENSNVPQRSTGQASKSSAIPDLTPNAPPQSTALHASESSSSEPEADPATTGDRSDLTSSTQPPQVYLPLIGQWKWAYGRPWAESINIIYGGKVHVHERDAKNGRRIVREGTLTIEHGNSCVFQFPSAPELNLRGMFVVDGEAIRITMEGEEIVMVRPDRVALYRDQAKREGTMSNKSEPDPHVVTQPGPPEKVEQPSIGAHVAVGTLPGKPGWTRVALRGDSVPGSELKDAVFRDLGIPVVNDRGDVGFAATIEGQRHVRSQQQQALFAVHGDRLGIQAEMTRNTRRNDDPPAVAFNNLQNSHLTEADSWCHPLHVDSQGRLIIRGVLKPFPAAIDGIKLDAREVTGYVRIDRGGVEPIIMAGQPAAEVPGTAWLAKSEYGADDRLLLCADDEVMFTGQTWKGRERGVDGVWKGSPENVRLTALNRGRLPDGKYAYGLLAIPVGRGEAVAHGQFLDDPQARDARSGFWIGPPTNWRLIAEEGKPLAGVADKRVVEHLRVTGSNHRGDVLLEIGFLGGPSKSLWKYTDGRFVPLPTPRKSQMRGLPTNSAWGIRRAVINSSGDVAVIMSTSVGGSGFLKQSLEWDQHLTKRTCFLSAG